MPPSSVVCHNGLWELGRDAQEYTLAEFTWPAVAEKYLGGYTR